MKLTKQTIPRSIDVRRGNEYLTTVHEDGTMVVIGMILTTADVKTVLNVMENFELFYENLCS